MCEVRWRSAVVAAALLVAARPMPAQRADDPMTAPRAALARARADLDATKEAWQQDSIQRSALPVVTTRHGVTLRADTSALTRPVLAIVQRELTAVQAELRALLGSAADSVLGGGDLSVLGIERVLGGGLWAEFWNGVVIRFDVNGSTHAITVGVASPTAAPRIGALMHGIATERVAQMAGSSIAPWPAAAPRLTALSPTEREFLYRGLRLNPSPVASACHDGALAACATGLALYAAERDTIDAWLDAARRRELVRARAADTLRDRGVAPAHRACVEQRDDAACLTLVVRNGVRPPLGVDARRELLRLALLRGGEGAWARLRDGTARTPTAMLEHVSGVPADTLLATLRAEVLAGRTPSPAPPASTWLSGGLWALLVTGLITRRRLTS